MKSILSFCALLLTLAINISLGEEAKKPALGQTEYILKGKRLKNIKEVKLLQDARVMILHDGGGAAAGFGDLSEEFLASWNIQHSEYQEKIQEKSQSEEAFKAKQRAAEQALKEYKDSFVGVTTLSDLISAMRNTGQYKTYDGKWFCRPVANSWIASDPNFPVEKELAPKIGLVYLKAMGTSLGGPNITVIGLDNKVLRIEIDTRSHLPSEAKSKAHQFVKALQLFEGELALLESHKYTDWVLETIAAAGQSNSIKSYIAKDFGPYTVAVTYGVFFIRGGHSMRVSIWDPKIAQNYANLFSQTQGR